MPPKKTKKARTIARNQTTRQKAPKAAPLVKKAGRALVALDVLGHDDAVQIVCNSARTVEGNLFRTLNELGVDGVSFQAGVFQAVTARGFSIDLDAIPDGPDSTLISVVNVIQNASRTV